MKKSILVTIFLFCSFLIVFAQDKEISKVYLYDQKLSVLIEELCVSDSVSKMIIAKDKEGLELIGFNEKYDIIFYSDVTEDSFCTNYALQISNINLEFITTGEISGFNKKNDRFVYANGELLTQVFKNSSSFQIQLMEIQIDYTQSEYFYFKNNPLCFLIISHPMNWVGKMSSQSFFQVLNFNEKIIMEFIAEY